MPLRYYAEVCFQPNYFIETELDVEKIKSLIPHRHPFLLIDSVHEIVKGEKIIASKFLSIEEPVFAGHFPSPIGSS